MRFIANDKRGPGFAPGPRPLLGLAAGLLLLLWPVTSLAHGVTISCREGRAMIIEAAYDDGEPMEYVKARVTGPDGKTFQVGNTDGHGRFAWVPDRSGQWTVTAADGMGHKAMAKVQAGPGRNASIPGQAAPVAQATASRWVKTLWGLNALLFIFGLWSWIASRRRTKRDSGA